tara:strand:- start:219 stop:770 length:552 start_codon:yes stop_codon:yes gene_type:complete
MLSLVFASLLGCSKNNKIKTAEVEDSAVIIKEESCGYKINNLACNFSLEDQHGEKVELYDHKGKVILLDFSTMWCVFCQIAAERVNAVESYYKEDDFIWITILIENFEGEPPTASDVSDWADHFEISAPVLAGSNDLTDPDSEGGYSVIGVPSFYLINQEGIITNGVSGWSEDGTYNLIDGLL